MLSFDIHVCPMLECSNVSYYRIGVFFIDNESSTYATNTTGTASHLNNTAATPAMMIRMIIDKLFFSVKFLNFKAIIGKVETMR